MKKSFRGLWVNIIYVLLFLITAVARIITLATANSAQNKIVVNILIIVVLIFFGLRFLIAYLNCAVVKENELSINGVFTSKKVKYADIEDYSFDDIILKINLKSGKTVVFNALNIPAGQREEFKELISEKIVL